jgi:selenocysteine lyase/cysteine desulfurase
VAEADDNGLVDPKEIEARIEEGTRLVAITHASNVTGTVNDIATIGALCDAKGIPLLVDAAQTAGCIPVDVERMRIDFLAFSGHKGLLGPQGTGGLYVREERRLAPLTRGGTGSLSDREEQPTFLPDMYESGTLNVPGIAGLGEGVAWILSHGVESVRNHDQHLREAFLDALGGQSRMRVFGPPGSASCTGAISLTIDGVSPSLVGELLENRYGILSRIGLHCAPRAHRTIGTYPEGTVRLSWGPFTRERDVRGAANALREISRTGSQLHA